MTKISVSAEDLKTLGYHLSYPKLLEKTKRGEPLASIIEDQRIRKEEEQKEKLAKIKKKRPLQEDDYDLEDPFIDDTEVTAQYESIFQVLDEEEDRGEGKEEGEEKKIKRIVNPDNLNFYVYRGPLEVDYVEK
jgi:hypothetical protein